MQRTSPRRLAAALTLAAALLLALAPSASADDHSLVGTSVQIDNTIESVAFDFPEETPFGSQGPVVIGDGIEFAECCDGFYEVDLSATRITMRWVGPDDFERVIEDGTFDRYYFTFDEPVLADATRAATATLPVNVTVVSPTELTVEVAPGMEIGDAFEAIIDVTLVDRELAVTGVDTWQLAIVGIALVAGGMLLTTWIRNPRVALAGKTNR